jgi:hypothetical protein
MRTGVRHDSPEEDGRPGAALRGPARHGQDGARARHLPGARQQGRFLRVLFFSSLKLVIPSCYYFGVKYSFSL